MNAIRRSVAQSARTTLSRQPRRYAHDAHHHHAEANESFGTGFYFAVGMIPAAFILYKLVSGPNEKPLTRWINSYGHWREAWEDRNDMHTRMIQKAADDRNLFMSSPSNRHVELKFPEIMNDWSPHNVPAGHIANIDKAIAHYQRKNYEENEKKLQALKDGTLKAEQPVAGRVNRYPRQIP